MNIAHTTNKQDQKTNPKEFLHFLLLFATWFCIHLGIALFFASKYVKIPEVSAFSREESSLFGVIVTPFTAIECIVAINIAVDNACYRLIHLLVALVISSAVMVAIEKMRNPKLSIKKHMRLVSPGVERIAFYAIRSVGFIWLASIMAGVLCMIIGDKPYFNYTGSQYILDFHPLVLGGLFSIMIATIYQETIFRGFLFRACQRCNLGILGTNLCISFLLTSMWVGSVNAWVLITIFINSMLAGWFYVRSNSLLVPIIHSALFMGFFGPCLLFFYS